MRKIWILTLLLLAADLWSDLGPKVIAAFRGQIIISGSEIGKEKSEKDMIAKIKKSQLKTIKGDTSEGATVWKLHYMAFLNQIGASDVMFEFQATGLKTGKSKKGVYKNISDIDPTLKLLKGEISISTDDGLLPNMRYEVSLKNLQNQVLAKTQLELK